MSNISKYQTAKRLAAQVLKCHPNQLNGHISTKYGVHFWVDDNRSRNWGPSIRNQKEIVAEAGSPKYRFIPSSRRWE